MSTTKFDQEEDINLEDPEFCFVELLPKERTAAPAPVITITWLETTDGLDTTFNLLRERVKQILKHNPAYTGTLVKSKEDKKIYIKYASQWDPEKDPSSVVDTIFQKFPKEAAIVHEGMELEAQRNLWKDSPFHLAPRQEFDRPGWMVSVVPSTKSSDRFALVVSTSHIYNDAKSHYLLYHMLVGMDPIRSLSVSRDNMANGWAKLRERLKGKNYELFWANFFFSYQLGMVYKGVKRFFTSWFSNQDSDFVHYCLVDPDKIRAIKDAYQKDKKEGDPDFISTNDIITSCFLSNKACAGGFMPVDARGKVEEFSKDHLGRGCLDVVSYRCPTDVKSPALIRQSLANSERAVSYNEPYKMRLAEILSNYCCVTNWVSASRDSSNPLNITRGCRQLVHFPIQVDILLPTLMSCVIFEPQPDQLACYFSTGGASLFKAGEESVASFATPLHVEALVP